MDNIEDIVVELNSEIAKLERYCKYAKDEKTLESLRKDIDILLARRDIWLSFLS